MEAEIADLLNLLELEQLEVNLFRGESRDVGSPQVFGGQVLGQALSAASATVAGRVVHSLHAYFLRRGDFNAPIVYQVDRSLDGHSFANRRVVAIQHGEQIFNMAASFQVVEAGLAAGLEHAIAAQGRKPRALFRAGRKLARSHRDAWVFDRHPMIFVTSLRYVNVTTSGAPGKAARQFSSGNLPHELLFPTSECAS